VHHIEQFRNLIGNVSVSQQIKKIKWSFKITFPFSLQTIPRHGADGTPSAVFKNQQRLKL
jgi:hypothetical protein